VEAFLNGSNGIRVMWTPDSQYRVTQSAYNAAARSQTVIPLRAPKCVLSSRSVREVVGILASNWGPAKHHSAQWWASECAYCVAHGHHMARRFLKAGVSGGAERAHLVAEIGAKEGVGAPLHLQTAGQRPCRFQPAACLCKQASKQCVVLSPRSLQQAQP
jgi:hypothetical protein